MKISRDLKSGFALYGLSRTAREVLELTRLLKVFEVYETEEAALRGGSSSVRRRNFVLFGGASQRRNSQHGIHRSIGEATIDGFAYVGKLARLTGARRFARFSSQPFRGQRIAMGPRDSSGDGRGRAKRFRSFR